MRRRAPIERLKERKKERKREKERERKREQNTTWRLRSDRQRLDSRQVEMHACTYASGGFLVGGKKKKEEKLDMYARVCMYVCMLGYLLKDTGRPLSILPSCPPPLLGQNERTLVDRAVD